MNTVKLMLSREQTRLQLTGSNSDSIKPELRPDADPDTVLEPELELKLGPAAAPDPRPSPAGLLRARMSLDACSEAMSVAALVHSSGDWIWLGVKQTPNSANNAWALRSSERTEPDRVLDLFAVVEDKKELCAG